MHMATFKVPHKLLISNGIMPMMPIVIIMPVRTKKVIEIKNINEIEFL